MKKQQHINEHDIERLLKQSFIEGTVESDENLLEAASEIVFGMEVEGSVPDHFEKQLLNKNKNFFWWKLVVLGVLLGFITWFILPTNNEITRKVGIHAQSEKNSNHVVNTVDSSGPIATLSSTGSIREDRDETKNVSESHIKQSQQFVNAKKIDEEKKDILDSDEMVKPIVEEKKSTGSEKNSPTPNHKFIAGSPNVTVVDNDRRKEKIKTKAPDFKKQGRKKIHEIVPTERNNQDLSDFEGTYFTENGYAAKLTYRGGELKLKVKGNYLKTIKTVTPDGKTVAMAKQGTETWFIHFFWNEKENIVGFTASEDNQNFTTYKKLID